MKRHLSLVDIRNASDDTWIDVDNRKAKRIKNRSKDKTVISASQPADLIDSVINAVAGDSANTVHTSCSSTQTDSSDFDGAGSNVSPMELMRCELRQLKETVTTLALKIDQMSKVMLSDLQPKTKPTDPSYASVTSAPAAAHSAPSASTNRNMSTHNVRGVQSSHDDQRHDPVTAMYIDLSIKKQRSNNIVITGMPPAQSPNHEMKAVIDLLTVEFGWDTDLCPGVSVARCRRLGKPHEGKFQPLLVTLDTREQAEFYIKNASQLRHSNQPEVRNNVFINSDLTPSEAKAAFELRQRRRQRKQESIAPINDPSAFPSRTFYQSSTANDNHNDNAHDNHNNHHKTVGSPTASNQQSPVPLITAAAPANLSTQGVDSPTQLNSSPCRLVYRSAVVAKSLDHDHLSEPYLPQVQPASSTCVQQDVVTNSQFDVAVEVHAPFDDAGRLANSKM